MAKKAKSITGALDRGITGGPKDRKQATKAVKLMNKGVNELRKGLRIK